MRKLLQANILNFHAPLLYLAIAIVFLFIGRVHGFINRYRADSLTETENKLRLETQAHAESKSSYYDTLRIVLTYLLTAKVPNFNECCRVTVYRAEEDGGGYFRQIFRYSRTSQFETNGRIKIPIDEGIVGAAWNNHGLKQFKFDEDPMSEEFREALRQALDGDQCKLPPQHVQLSMPTRHFYAKAIQDFETGRKSGIIVYECTNVHDLDVPGIVDVLQAESVNMLRFIRHIVALDRDFNPDAKAQHGKDS